MSRALQESWCPQPGPILATWNAAMARTCPVMEQDCSMHAHCPSAAFSSCRFPQHSKVLFFKKNKIIIIAF